MVEKENKKIILFLTFAHSNCSTSLCNFGQPETLGEIFDFFIIINNMGFTLFTIPIGIISLLLIFLFSTDVAGWFVWGIYGIMSIFFFIKSFTEYKSMLKGEPKSVTDIMGIASFPFTTSIMGIILIIFLFLNINKLQLLWIYPVVALLFDFTIGRRAGKKVSPNSLEKIEK